MVPRFSVVLPVKDRADSVCRAAVGVLAQTFDDLELIVVDLHSTDGTIEAVRTVADDRVRILHCDEPVDLDRARALGLGHARGRWSAVIDADTVPRPRWLARIGRLGDRTDAASVTCGGVQHHGDGSMAEVTPMPNFCRPGAVVTRRLPPTSDPSAPDSEGDVTRSGPISTPEPLLDWFDGPVDPAFQDPDAPTDERLLRWATDALFTLGNSPIPSADLVAHYATVAGVAAARLHRHPEAQRMLSVARRIRPGELRPLLRWAVATVPPLSDRVFAATPN